MKVVQSDDVRAWVESAGSLAPVLHTLGPQPATTEYLEGNLGVPLHLAFVIERLAAERGAPVAEGALDSIPFYSLCTGLFLPLSGMAPEKVAQLFGIIVPPPLDSQARENLIRRFLDRETGLGLLQKLGCILGQPFRGKKSTFRRDSLVRLTSSVRLARYREMLDRLTMVGDVAVLMAETRPSLREEPALTSAEVLETLRFLPGTRRTLAFDVLRSMLLRCGKLEAYFLARLLLCKAGIEYQGSLIARVLATSFGASEEAVAHAIALTDVFHVAEALQAHGPQGLHSIRLKPLAPVRPALAGGTADEIDKFPVWVERKYDGIRLMLHKSTDALSTVLCGAYTRNRGDWLELVPGLDATIKMIPARDAIVDGELYGTVLSLDGARPATVYEVYAALQGERAQPVHLKFAAFDLLYLNGHDLTSMALAERRARLQALLAPLAAFSLPVPLLVAEGQLASSRDDVNRLFHHFRAQGYEGIIAKDLNGRYLLSERDPAWRKRKPEVTLDLVLLGAVLAVTTKEHAGVFGSYLIGARRPDGSFEDVGDVAGVDRVRDAEIQAEILREGLLTGRRIERPSASGVRPGMELLPHIVVTVRFEGVTRDHATGRLSLRDPKLVVIRADKHAHETDSTTSIEELYLRQRVG
ncbi:MAG: hypothetical protein AB1714_20225 [Acidobacteriota bacterium]